MAEELEQAARVLGGEIETQFIYRPEHTSIDTALRAVIADQEAICGYPLVLVKSRSMELADREGNYMEVFVTLGPVPKETQA